MIRKINGQWNIPALEYIFGGIQVHKLYYICFSHCMSDKNTSYELYASRFPKIFIKDLKTMSGNKEITFIINSDKNPKINILVEKQPPQIEGPFANQSMWSSYSEEYNESINFIKNELDKNNSVVYILDSCKVKDPEYRIQIDVLRKYFRVNVVHFLIKELSFYKLLKPSYKLEAEICTEQYVSYRTNIYYSIY